jgi:hypothetical protein
MVYGIGLGKTVLLENRERFFYKIDLKETHFNDEN